ncbi:MAG: hypothetical protein U1F70_09905 [Candidatus Competibacteraceae bacterium]
MMLFQLDDAGLLFMGPDIDDWAPIKAASIDAIIDMDGGFDTGVIESNFTGIYLFFPFDDVEQLPDVQNLHAIGELGASLIRRNKRVLSHCGMGHNRSALVAGMILFYLGFPKEAIVTRIQQRRVGALYNKSYRRFLENL